jgi:4a-hydroxytetrahydrobiopterin dehydratase
MENKNIRILKRKEIKEMLNELPGWVYKRNKISKEYKFNDFMEVIGFVNEMAPYFVQVDHHPEMHISYKKLIFDLQRFDVGKKVTDLDFIVAREIERKYLEKDKRL